MPADLPLRCACGTVRGAVRDFSPATSGRMVCYCRDCQAFARFLENPGMLDAAGGTEVVLVAPGRLRFTTGVDPFFDARTRTPRAVPRVLGPEERAALGV